MPASAKSAASVQNGAPTTSCDPVRACTTRTISSSGETSIGSRPNGNAIEPSASPSSSRSSASTSCAALAGDRASLPLQQAPCGIARVLLTALDQRGVHRSGAEQRVTGPGLQRLIQRLDRRRGPAPSWRSRRRRDRAASRGRRGRGSRCRRRASPDARCRGARRSARRRSPRPRASVRAAPRCRCSRLLVDDRGDDHVAAEPAPRALGAGDRDRREARLHVVGAAAVEASVRRRAASSPPSGSSSPTVSRCPFRISVRPPPLPRATPTRSAGPERPRRRGPRAPRARATPRTRRQRRLAAAGRDERRVDGVDGDELRRQLRRHQIRTASPDSAER